MGSSIYEKENSHMVYISRRAHRQHARKVAKDNARGSPQLCDR